MIKWEIIKLIKSKQILPIIIGVIITFVFAAMNVELFSEFIPATDVKAYIWLSFEIGGSMFLPIVMAYVMAASFAQEYQLKTLKILWKGQYTKEKIFDYKCIATMISFTAVFLATSIIYCILVFSVIKEFDPYFGNATITQSEYIFRIVIVFLTRNLQVLTVGTFSILLTVIIKNKVAPFIIIFFLFMIWDYLPFPEKTIEFLNKYILFFNNDYVYGLTPYNLSWTQDLLTAVILYLLEFVVFYVIAKEIFCNQEL